MPTENVLNRNFDELFNIEVRFEVPFFREAMHGSSVNGKNYLKIFKQK
jgi:hypothetical protein